MTTEQQAEFDRLRSYHNAQGERYSFAELWPRITKARLQLLDLLDGLSDEQAGFKAGPEEWCIRDAASHLLTSSRSVRGLVAALSSGQPGETRGVEAGGGAVVSTVAELRRGLRDDAIAWSSLTQELPERPATALSAPHPMFGELHARAWYLFQRTHDLDHVGQIERVKQAAGYPESTKRE